MTAAEKAYAAQRDQAIAQAQALLARLERPVEHVTWGHAGTLEKVNADLAELIRFAGA